ncbi:MAG: hypothetical protein K0S32_397 [Bacteroidetes bacterium]|jgi:hypothetical protein|nr:hypothetical protein [Bacteroidota bacterium]
MISSKIKLTQLLFLVAIIPGFFSCKKTAGEGGNSSIRGSILIEDWNAAFTVKQREYPAADADVYIIYGDNVSYDDRTRANYNGEFEFRYLRKGKYKIYVYSKDKTLQSVSGDVAIVKDVEITDKKQTVTTDQFTVYD